MKTENTLQDNAAGLRVTLRLHRNNIEGLDRNRGSLLMRGRLYTWLALQRDAARQDDRPAPARIAAFWPLDGEPDLRNLLGKWVEEDGLQVLLPVVTAPASPLAFRAWTPDTAMRSGAFGVQEPEGENIAADAALPDVILVPTLGWTEAGDRLGYGGGYYDRTLAILRQANPALITIGVAWEEGRLPAGYQAQAHDARLDAIVTPVSWYPEAP